MCNEKPKGQASFYIFHHVGAVQEEDSQHGLAHFLEHMAFNGTKNLPGKKMIEYLERNGVKFGADLNACLLYTSLGGEAPASTDDRNEKAPLRASLRGGAENKS